MICSSDTLTYQTFQNVVSSCKNRLLLEKVDISSYDVFLATNLKVDYSSLSFPSVFAHAFMRKR
jgi:hypothetical protein